MDKKFIEESLLSIGYSTDMVKTILERSPKNGKRTKPSYDNMIVLLDRFGIPLEAWRDIKSFIAKSSQKSAN